MISTGYEALGIEMMGAGVSVEAEFYIESLLEKGSVTTLAGAPGTGKTALILQLTDSIMTGKPFHGLEVKNTGNVMWVQYDSTHIQFERYCSRYCPGLRFPAITLNGKHRLNLFNDTPMLIQLCKDQGIDVVVFDTLAAIARGVDENNNAHMTSVYDKFTDIANAGISVIILHHMSKGEFGPSTNVRGASAITASTYNEWKLVDTKNGIDFIITKSREVEKRTVFTIDVSKDSISAYEKASPLDMRVQCVVDLIKEKGEITRSEIQESLNVHNVTLKPVLEKVATLPMIEKTKSGKSDVYKYVNVLQFS